MANTKHVRNARQGGDLREEIAEGLEEAVDPGAEPVELCSDCLATQDECTCYDEVESYGRIDSDTLAEADWEAERAEYGYDDYGGLDDYEPYYERPWGI